MVLHDVCRFVSLPHSTHQNPFPCRSYCNIKFLFPVPQASLPFDDAGPSSVISSSRFDSQTADDRDGSRVRRSHSDRTWDSKLGWPLDEREPTLSDGSQEINAHPRLLPRAALRVRRAVGLSADLLKQADPIRTVAKAPVAYVRRLLGGSPDLKSHYSAATA
jgi:hypothetical protein